MQKQALNYTDRIQLSKQNQFDNIDQQISIDQNTQQNVIDTQKIQENFNNISVLSLQNTQRKNEIINIVNTTYTKTEIDTQHQYFETEFDIHKNEFVALQNDVQNNYWTRVENDQSIAQIYSIMGSKITNQDMVNYTYSKSEIDTQHQYFETEFDIHKNEFVAFQNDVQTNYWTRVENDQSIAQIYSILGSKITNQDMVNYTYSQQYITDQLALKLDANHNHEIDSLQTTAIVLDSIYINDVSGNIIGSRNINNQIDDLTIDIIKINGLQTYISQTNNKFQDYSLTSDLDQQLLNKADVQPNFIYNNSDLQFIEEIHISPLNKLLKYNGGVQYVQNENEFQVINNLNQIVFKVGQQDVQVNEQLNVFNKLLVNINQIDSSIPFISTGLIQCQNQFVLKDVSNQNIVDFQEINSIFYNDVQVKNKTNIQDIKFQTQDDFPVISLNPVNQLAKFTITQRNGRSQMFSENDPVFDNNTYPGFLELYSQGTRKGFFRKSNGSYSTASDKNLKKDIQKYDIKYQQKNLDQFLQLEFNKYKYKTNGKQHNSSFGIIAQNIQQLDYFSNTIDQTEDSLMFDNVQFLNKIQAVVQQFIKDQIKINNNKEPIQTINDTENDDIRDKVEYLVQKYQEKQELQNSDEKAFDEFMHNIDTKILEQNLLINKLNGKLNIANTIIDQQKYQMIAQQKQIDSIQKLVQKQSSTLAQIIDA